MLFSISDIFRSEETKHHLTLFKTIDVEWLETQLFEKDGKPFCVALSMAQCGLERCWRQRHRESV